MADGFLLQGYLEEAKNRYSANIAVTDGVFSMTYGDVAILSNQIAHGLLAMGVKRGDRVAICLPRTAYFLPTILGVLKADACYVPLDGKTPLPRLLHILGDATPTAIICDAATLALMRQARRDSGAKTEIMALCPYGDALDDVMTLNDIRTFSVSPPACQNSPDDLAYVLYTSGSTGQPKGVMISHANVRAYIDWAHDFFRVDAKDRILATAPFHFDMSTFDIYCALKAGATLCIANDMQVLFPAKLVEFIEGHQVTLWKGVASLLMYMARAGVLMPGAMPSLRQVIFAGEALPTRHLIAWMSAFPEKLFYNAYGPTEATGVSICHRVEKMPAGPDVRIPIGRPRVGTRVLLLDDDLGEVPDGEFGELCLAGAGLAKGYLNDPVKTATAFIAGTPDLGGERIYRTGDLACRLPDGTFDFLGRKDRQLKFMGYRIEAGEIERALLSLPQIENAVVQLVDTGRNDGGQELVAFFESAEALEPALVVRELKMRLPAYMIPRHLIRVDCMPRCDRGKIEMATLRQHYQCA